MRTHAIAAGALGWLILAGGALAGELALHQVQAIPLQDVKGRIDHMAVDLGGHRLFVAALENNTVEIVDLQSGEHVGRIGDLKEPQGVVFLPDLNRLAVSNGGNGTVQEYNGQTVELVAQMDLGDDADNMRYDAGAKRLYVGCGDGTLSALNAADLSPAGDIRLPAHPESFVLEEGGPRIFINVPGARVIAVADRAKGKLIAKWPPAEAGGNFPMALDSEHGRLFVGCRKPAVLLVLDEATGGPVAKLPLHDDVDDVSYDAKRDRIYVSCGAGTLDVFGRVEAGLYGRIDEVTTAAGARTSLFVPESDRLYLAVPAEGRRPAEIRVFEPR